MHETGAGHVTDDQEFRALVEPFRRELQLHCYRIVGSIQDAEDLVQETLLAAWRGLERFEGRASLRSWLYRIATNRCLNAMRDSGRRPRAAAGNGERFQRPEPTHRAEPIWLDPYPDVLLEDIADVAPGPDARHETREALALGFVAGLQHLPPRQRAVLVLRDVLGFRAAEVADMLETSEASVNSALQRARSALEERAPARERAPLPTAASERELLGRFADAFERGDVDSIVALMTDDAWLRMPPDPEEYQGHAAITRFLGDLFQWRAGKGFRLVPTRANSQPAFGYYLEDPRAPIAHAGGVQVLTITGDRISAITRFGDVSVFPYFGLPRTLRW
ncbi:MAG TPA: sigma-70 family RNA polymerase sigma factor [Solirubrobacteraceae bacterium]|jgi:RNA polymerase sigma-70 factor (ECF subfamily)